MGNEFDITLAANGEEGLSRYAEINPDIIVADIMMPKMDGFTMVKLIRKTDTHTPCPIPIGPFRGQRRGRGLRDRRQRFPEKAFRHGGIDRTHQRRYCIRCPSKDRKPPLSVSGFIRSIPSRRHWSTGERNNSSATGNPRY